MPSNILTTPLDRNGVQKQYSYGGGANTVTTTDYLEIGYLIKSGGGSDTVTGSINDDVIMGGDGADVLTGGGGGDIIYGGDDGGPEKVSKNGGPSSNLIYGDYEIIDLRGGLYEGPLVTDPLDPNVGNEGVNGDDTIYGGDYASNTIYGDAWNLILGDGSVFVGSNDTIYGGDGDGVNSTTQFLYGDALVINTVTDSSATGGGDTIVGGDNTTNTIVGDFTTTVGGGGLTFVGGVDILTGGDGSTNTIYGDGGRFSNSGSFTGANDILAGGANGENFLYGDVEEIDNGAFTGGADTLIGGANAVDWMYGDYNIALSSAAGTAIGGADNFVIGLGGGEDHIMDFRQIDGDQVDLSAFAFTEVADLAALWVDDGGALALDLGGGNTVTFENIAYADFDSGAFVFTEADFIF